MKTYKGFREDMTCHEHFQYEEGKEYTEEGPIKVCEKGFHSCENPLNVFSYYDPCYVNQFHEVEIDGETSTDGHKIASSKIKIGKRLSLSEMVKKSVDWFWRQKVLSYFSCVDPSKCAIEIGQKATAYDGNAPVAATLGIDSFARTDRSNGVAVASAYNSMAETTRSDSNAITEGHGSIALTTGNSSVAQTNGEISIAMTTGTDSIAIANERCSTAITEGMVSLAIGMKFSSDVIVKERGSLGIAFCGGVAKSDTLNSYLLLSDHCTQDAAPGHFKLIYIDGKEYKPHTWYYYSNDEVKEMKYDPEQ